MKGAANEREPTDSLRDKSSLTGGWLPSLTSSLDGNTPLLVNHSYRKEQCRTGLRIRGARGHPEVRQALLRFADWLRMHFDFPVRVPAYLLSRSYVITQGGVRCSASFFAPQQMGIEPFIRIATGDYPSLKAERGRNNALAAFIGSFAHEIIHYQQWIETGEVWEHGVARKVNSILTRYSQTTDHP